MNDMADQAPFRLFVLITGRTQAQTKGMHLGKSGDIYRDAVSSAMMHPDMFKIMDIQEGHMLRLRTSAGEITVKSQADPGLPCDMLFLPMGPVANMLIPAATGGCGMPSFKGLSVEVRPE